MCLIRWPFKNSFLQSFINYVKLLFRKLSDNEIQFFIFYYNSLYIKDLLQLLYSQACEKIRREELEKHRNTLFAEIKVTERKQAGDLQVC